MVPLDGVLLASGRASRPNRTSELRWTMPRDATPGWIRPGSEPSWPAPGSMRPRSASCTTSTCHGSTGSSPVGSADRAVAEDLTAMTFERGLGAVRGEGFRNDAFGGWLYRVAANAVVDHVRRDRRTVPFGTRAGRRRSRRRRRAIDRRRARRARVRRGAGPRPAAAGAPATARDASPGPRPEVLRRPRARRAVRRCSAARGPRSRSSCTGRFGRCAVRWPRRRPMRPDDDRVVPIDGPGRTRSWTRWPRRWPKPASGRGPPTRAGPCWRSRRLARPSRRTCEPGSSPSCRSRRPAASTPLERIERTGTQPAAGAADPSPGGAARGGATAVAPARTALGGRGDRRRRSSSRSSASTRAGSWPDRRSSARVTSRPPRWSATGRRPT